MKPSRACTPCKYYVEEKCENQETIDALGWCPEFANRYIERLPTGK